MCPSKDNKVTIGLEPTAAAAAATMAAASTAKLNGRQVFQPTCNRVPTLERKNSIKKVPPPKSLSVTRKTSTATSSLFTTPPVSPKSKSPRPPAMKRGNNNNDSNSLNSSSEKVMTPRSSMIKTSSRPTLERKKSWSFKEGSVLEASFSYCSSLITESPGSIAAVRRDFGQRRERVGVRERGERICRYERR